MSDSMIVAGEKLHIISRRLFSDDLRRHFAGEVIRAADDLCELKGYVFVFLPGSGEYKKRSQPRHRIFSVGDAMFIVNKLPAEIDLEALEYRVIDDRLVVTDNNGFLLDINEFGPSA